MIAMEHARFNKMVEPHKTLHGHGQNQWLPLEQSSEGQSGGHRDTGEGKVGEVGGAGGGPGGQGGEGGQGGRASVELRALNAAGSVKAGPTKGGGVEEDGTVHVATEGVTVGGDNEAPATAMVVVPAPALQVELISYSALPACLSKRGRHVAWVCIVVVGAINAVALILEVHSAVLSMIHVAAAKAAGAAVAAAVAAVVNATANGTIDSSAVIPV